MIQTYEGIRYYPTKKGYLRSDSQHGGAYLARIIYSREYGNIPHGWHIHHKDENKLNNAIENLECLSSAEHADRHPEKPWEVRAFVCEVCRKSYQAKVNGRGNRTCSMNCRQKLCQRRKVNGQRTRKVG